jgi:D-psicose/D-tagatose/L-ribulose 3-epimerase
MKIGIHQHVYTSRLNDQNLEILDLIRDIGFDSVDFNVRNMDIGFAKTIRKKTDKLGIIPTAGGSLPKSKVILSEKKEKRREAIDYMKELIRKTSEIGAELYHGLIYATGGIFTGKGPEEREVEYAVEGLKEAAVYAKKYGVSLCLEPANRYETYMLNTVSDSLKMLCKIDEPNVGLLLDSYHMNIEEKNMYGSIVSAKDKLFHFHVNENDRGIPGTGHIPWDDVFKALKDINYKGIAAIESFVDSSIDIASLVAVWRRLAPSADTLAKEGYRFIKDMADKYYI